MNPMELPIVPSLEAYIWPSLWLALGIVFSGAAYLIIKKQEALKIAEAERLRRKKK